MILYTGLVKRALLNMINSICFTNRIGSACFFSIEFVQFVLLIGLIRNVFIHMIDTACFYSVEFVQFVLLIGFIERVFIHRIGSSCFTRLVNNTYITTADGNFRAH